jgi:hypothetical protein
VCLPPPGSVAVAEIYIPYIYNLSRRYIHTQKGSSKEEKRMYRAFVKEIYMFLALFFLLFFSYYILYQGRDIIKPGIL